MLADKDYNLFPEKTDFYRINFIYPFKNFNISDLEVIPLETNHLNAKAGKNGGEPSLGFIMKNENGQCFTYLLDASQTLPGRTMDFLKHESINCPVIDCTYEHSTTTRTVTRDDGTVVTIVEVVDDNNTPDNASDDTVTVTRTYDIWAGAQKQDKIVRPKKPGLEWAGWQNGSEVNLAEIVKETHRIDRNGVVVKVDTVIDTDGLQTKTKYRIKVTASGDIVVHKFTYEEFIGDDGQVYTRIVRDDGSYAVILQKKNPRITEYYTAEGTLRMRVTETRDKSTGELSVVKEMYDASGNLIATKNVSFQYKFLGDEVVITKIFDNGKKLTMTVQESDEGYTVNRNGFVYSVKFEGSDVLIYDADSNLIATVTFNSDGSLTVTYADSSKGSETLNL